jgi:hypothetical protein
MYWPPGSGSVLRVRIRIQIWILTIYQRFKEVSEKTFNKILQFTTILTTYFNQWPQKVQIRSGSVIQDYVTRDPDPKEIITDPQLWNPGWKIFWLNILVSDLLIEESKN